MEKHNISRRNALRMLGAMCAGTVLSSRADVLSASTRTKVKPEEQNRNSRYRNPNVRVGEIILANSQVNYNG